MPPIPWLSVAAVVSIVIAAAIVLVVARVIRARNMQIWLPAWLRRRPRAKHEGPTHVMFCFVDHYEPMHGRPGLDIQSARVDRWCRDYRALAGRHRDADGRHPQHRSEERRGGKAGVRKCRPRWSPHH